MFVSAKALYRLVVKILVVFMVIQGWALWELRNFEEFSFITDIFDIQEAYAAGPVADAGVDQSVSKNQPLGGSIALDGSGSYDPDGDPLTYQWYGPFATGFLPVPLVYLSEGTYSISLTVDDGTSRSEVDTAVITVSPCFNIYSRAKRGKVQLTWTHQDGTERYDVYRSDESDPFSFEKIGEATSTYSTYLDDTVLNESTYLYVVGAYTQDTWCYSDVISSHPTAIRTRVPVNYAPVIYSSPITHGTIGIIYNYDVNAADPNGDALSYSLSTSPLNMDIDPDTGLITWIPDDTGSFGVTVDVSDPNGETDTQTFTIVVEDIISPNRPPVANAGPDQTAFVMDTVQLDGSGSSDLDGDALTYEWSFVSVPAGSTAGISDPTVVNPGFSIDLPGTYVVQLIVNDGKVDSDPDTVTISTENSPPVADAGPDQTVLVDDTVTLDGTGSTDVDGDLLSFTWSFVSVPDGSTVSLSDPNSVEPTFVLDVAGTYVVQLIVNDGMLDSDPDTVTISTENRKPVAHAGPDQTVFVDDTVTLDGSGSSDVDGDLLNFMWSFTSVPDGSMAVLSDPTAVNPGFDIDEPGIYVVQLIVNDGVLDSDPDTVMISTENRKPVAHAGPDQTVFVDDTVTLDGSGSSDVDGDLLSFMWSFTSIPDGSMAALSDPTAVNPSFDIDEPGIYVVQLIVNDGVLDSDPDTVTISTENRRPLADAGPDQTAFVMDTVQLDGSGSSDVDGDALTYEWSFISVPEGSTASLSEFTLVNPTFVVDLPGTYLVQLIVNDETVDSDPDTVTISTQNSPPVADAGPDQTAFVGNTVTLDGSSSSDVDGDLLTFNWSFTSIPGGSVAILSDPAAVNPTFVIDEPGSYVVQLIVNDGTVNSDPDSVTITTENSPPVADAGSDQTVFVTETVQLDGSGSDDADGNSLTFMWSFTSRPAGSTATLSDSAIVNPTFVADLHGTYTVQLIVNDGTVDSDPDSVVISTQNSRPVANAGSDQMVSIDDTVTLDGSGSSDVDGDPLTYQWSFTSIPSGSGATLSDPATIDPTFEADLSGTYVVQLIVNDGTLDSDPDTVTITAVQVNSPPAITSAPVTTGTEDQLYTYDVEAEDPDIGDVLTFSLDASPAGMTIDATTGLVQWTPTSGQVGNNDVTVRVEDTGGLFDTQSFTVTVADVNDPPGITSTPITTATEGQPYSYDVDATDPDIGDVLAFSLDASPAGMTIDAATGLVQWTPTSSQVGDNDVTVRVEDTGGLFDTQTFVIDVQAGHVDDTVPPVVVVSASPGVVNIGDNATISVTATDNVGVVSLELKIDSAPVPLDPSGEATFSSDTPGVFEAIASAHDAAGNGFSDCVEIMVIDPGIGSIPTAVITAPAEDAVLQAPVDVIGTASGSDFLNYKLHYAEHGTDDFVEFAEGTAPVTNDVLGAFDPTSLSNGLYTIRLTATAQGGNQAIASTIVEVDGNRKIGPFTVSFRDKIIPIGNFPLTVTRTYDSRDKTKGDFGIGWNLSLADAKLVENRIPGSDWEQTKSGGWIPTYTLVPTKSHTVTIRFGDDKKLEFRAQPNPQSQQIYPINYLNSMDYIPIGDTEGTLVPDVQPYFVIGGVGPVEFFTFDLDLYNPGAFTYTAPDGFVYLFERSPLSSLRFQLTRITNPNGVTITLSADGILRSDGKSIGFTRDAEGRIIRLEDPKGNELNYEYNIRGDLAAFIDGEGNRTTFVYDADHNLLQIRDPLGRPIQRQEYDDDGRLISITNGAGDRIVIEHDLSSNREIVYDHRNNPTIYEYDGNGNVIRQTEFPTVNGAVQEVVTIRAYDADNQLISETKPNGSTITFVYSPEGKLSQKVVDAGAGSLNLTTTYTYNSSGRLLTTMDPRGNMVTNVYDGNGNLISRTDREDKTTTYQHNAGGQVTRETDPLGNYTVFTYDSFGNKTREERFASDGTRLGLVEFTYDDNGNELTETIFVTIGGTLTPSTTSFEFDANDQLTAETDALGNRKQIEYNAVGQKIAEVDKRGHRTEFTYDERGNLTRIDHPDGSATVYGYDADSNRNSITDCNGNTTMFVFDALDRIIRADFPDGSSRVKHYDAVGNMIAEIDESGNRTDHEYDAAGRRVRTLQPLVYDAVRDATIRPETLYEYDENGNRTAVIDANGNRTEFTYNKENRKTKTTFPDTREAIIVYDAIGQKIEQTDPCGLTTTYEYNALKRLVKVTLPPPGTGDPNPETLYEYNEAGNLIAQTDGNGHITGFEYDIVGRRTARMLPGGQTETFNYDAENNVVSHVDFNGDSVNSTYDADGHRTLVQYPDGSGVTTTYNGEGKRLQVTDTRGDTTFVYDSRSRLVEVTDPSGHEISYEYDGAGNTLSVTSPGGATNYTYDPLNRLATVTDTNAGVTTYRYDAVGNQVRITNANGTNTVHTYNSRNQLVNLENLKSDGTTVIDSYAYTLNANGLRTSIVEQDGSTVSYEYDDNYRLIRETRAGGASPYDIQYSHDPVGNRISMNRDGVVTSYAYDGNDRLQAAGGVVYSYDDNGNRTTKTEGADTIAYEYDYENRLIRSVAPGGAVTGYSYDANGNRVRKQDESGIVDYLVDIRSVTGVPQVIEERDGSDALQVMYIYGHDLLSQDRSSSLSYYHYDGLGSTRNLSDVSEAVTDSYTYDAYGRETASSGSTVNSYRFAGEQFDPNIGFYYLRARYYDQETGRFVTMDPLLGDPQSPISLHRYLYANDNPVNFVDPTGQCTLIEIQISLNIQSSLRSIYTKHLLKFFFNAVEIAFCQLEPAYELQWFAFEMIMRNTPGGCNLLNLSQRMISDAFLAISKAAAETYLEMFKEVANVEFEVSGLLTDMYDSITSGSIPVPVPDEVEKLLKLRDELSKKLGKVKKAYGHAAVLIRGGGSNCTDWKAISFFANEAIDNWLPDF